MTTEPEPTLAQIAEDDALLDALGGGVAGTEPGDAATELLTAWRASLDEDMPDASSRPAAVKPRRRLLAVAMAAAVAALAGSVTIGAAQSGPGSPLWPLTEVFFPAEAEVRSVEDVIDRAREAIAEGRPDEARLLLDEATGLLAGIEDSAEQERLATRIDELRLALEAPGSPAPPSAPPSEPPASAEPDETDQADDAKEPAEEGRPVDTPDPKHPTGGDPPGPVLPPIPTGGLPSLPGP